jgi:phospholipid-translocating ATPase
LQTDKLILFCKGAENSIFAKCIIGDIKNCNNVIDEFAEQGWRTLALAYRILDQKEYESYSFELEDAYNDLNNREEKLSQLYDKIESNLILIGSTAVEDRLQEDVPNTLETLRRAGIKIWILTGDKKETAVNISESCKHFSYDMQRLYLTDFKIQEVIAKELRNHERMYLNYLFNFHSYYFKHLYIVDIFKIKKRY